MHDVYVALTDDRPLMNQIGGLYDVEPVHDKASMPYAWLPGPNVLGCTMEGKSQMHRIKVSGRAQHKIEGQMMGAAIIQALIDRPPFRLATGDVAHVVGGTTTIDTRSKAWACVDCEIVLMLDPQG